MTIPIEYLKKNWYYNSKCFVSFSGGNFKLFKTSQGVGQGSVQRLYVYVYMNDLLYDLFTCKSTKGVPMGSLHIPGIVLADDTA